MINAINQVNHNGYNKSFGQNKQNTLPQRPSKAAIIAKYAASQVVAGAAVSLIVDGVANLAKKAFPKLSIPHVTFKQAMQRAGVWGVAFLGMSVVLNTIFNVFNKNK